MGNKIANEYCKLLVHSVSTQLTCYAGNLIARYQSLTPNWVGLNVNDFWS